MPATSHKPAPITHSAVKSSQIKSFGYDSATQTLEIRFTSGGLYRYSNVTAKTHAEFMAAESAGKYFGAHIRGKFPHALVKESAQ